MKYFKRITGLVLIISLLLATVGVSSFAATSDFTIKDGILTAYSGSDVDLVIPDNLGITRIYMYAFSNCKTLKTVTIPANIEKIDSNAFVWCSSLTDILVAEANANYSSVGGVLLSRDKITLVTYPCGKTGGYIIPKTVTNISSMAFAGCEGLTSVTLPESLNVIETNAFTGCSGLEEIAIPANVNSIKDMAFGSCGSLTSITVAGENTSYASMDGVLFTKDFTTLLRFPGGKTGSYTIPAGVKIIGSSAFEGCTKLFGVTIPMGVTTIGFSAFSGSNSLIKLIISSSVTQIDSKAFDGCSNLTIYAKEGTPAESIAKAKGSGVAFSPLSLNAAPTASPVLVNGSVVKFEAYSINDNNYFKLRDLAKVISGTDRQFEVGWDSAKGAISLTTGKTYTSVGGELSIPSKTATVVARISTAVVYLNGTEICLKAYEINGNNYFKLRDVAEAIDFGVTWNEEKSTIAIDTSSGYVFE